MFFDMACNCKKTVDKINEKYGDGGKDVKKPNIFAKILQFILQIFVGILCGAIIIVMIVPMLIYIIISMMFGKQVVFRIKNPNKYLK